MKYSKYDTIFLNNTNSAINYDENRKDLHSKDIYKQLSIIRRNQRLWKGLNFYDKVIIDTGDIENLFWTKIDTFEN